MTMGGVYMYRAVAECSSCGRVVDVGPFESITDAYQNELSGWLTPANNLSWRLTDGFGTPFTVCPTCLSNSMVYVLDNIKKRQAALTASEGG